MKLRPNLHRDWPENRFQANNADESQKRQQKLMFVYAVCISDLEANNRKCSLIFPASYWLKSIAECRVSSLTQQTGVAAWGNTFAAVRNGKCLFFLAQPLSSFFSLLEQARTPNGLLES